jgi:dephospho-CoA kinase
MNGRPERQQQVAPLPRDPFVIGLTGPIAAGKSTVAAMLRQRGARVIDADRVYHALLAPGSALSSRIGARFGSGVIAADGGIDRAALARIVFADPIALANLDAITHPAIVAKVRQEIATAIEPVVAVEAVKLAQSALLDDIDALWLVDAEPEVRLRRLVARSSLSEAQARARVAAQPEPLPPGVQPVVVIDNSRGEAATASQVEAAWQALDLPSCSLEPVGRAMSERKVS